MVRFITVTSLYNMMKTLFHTLGLYTLKTSKDRKFSKTCSSGGRLVRRRQLEPAWKKGHVPSQLCRWLDRHGSSLDPGQLAPTAHAMAPFTGWRPEAGIPPGMASCGGRLQARQPPRPRPWTLSN